MMFGKKIVPFSRGLCNGKVAYGSTLLAPRLQTPALRVCFSQAVSKLFVEMQKTIPIALRLPPAVLRPLRRARPPARTANGTTAFMPSMGFTLIEILISIAIFGIIFSFIYGTLTNTLSAGQSAKTRMDVQQVGRFIVKRMSKDLSSATLLEKSKRGAFLGKTRTSDGKFHDEIHFTAFTHLYYRPNRPVTDQSEIGYYFVVPSEGAEVLMRRESDVIEASVELGGISFEITELVSELKIRYYQNQTEGWIDGWDSKAKKIMPKLVLIELTLNDGRRDYFFSAVVRLPNYA